MAPTSQELALRYLLELSSDIRIALLLDSAAGLVAAAPHPPPGRLAELAGELTREAGTRFGANGVSKQEPVEIDAACEGGAVFLVHTGDGAMVCVTERSVLPGLIFYDMHAVLSDLDRAAGAETRRVGAGR